MYQIPCKDCPNIYADETEGMFGAVEKEHRKDVALIIDKKYTR